MADLSGELFLKKTSVNINNSSGLFPLGSATEWRPFSVGKGGSGAGTVTVSHNSVGTTSVVSFADSRPSCH